MTTHHLTLKIWIIILVMAFAAACSDSGSTGVGSRCDTDSDCGDGLKCNSLGQCITIECSTDSDCPDEKICNDSNECVEPDPSEEGCTIDTDCPDGYVCVIPGGYCEQVDVGCTSSADCAPGQYCAANGICRSRSEADVEITDGDVTDGDVTDGDVTDGDVTDGDETDGDEDVEVEPPCDMNVDSDNDLLPDCIEDKNQNGEVDPLETDPNDPDSDDDGLLDGEEDANQDGLKQFNETDPLDPDTDFDKLKDGEEDANHNGIFEPELGETDPLRSDTDGDNVIDGNELEGGYTEGNSDPNDSDTDDDTIPDGEEDRNGNGIYEPELGETDPTLADSDNDGTDDNEESVYLLCGQEANYRELALHENVPGNWTLALQTHIPYVELDMAPPAGETLQAAAFEDATNSVAGFILAKPLAAGRVSNQVSEDNALLDPLPSSGGLNHRGRTYGTYDGFDGMVSRYSVTTANLSVGEVRNRVLGLLSNRNVAAIGNLPNGPSAMATEFTILTDTIIRLDDGNVIIIGAILTTDAYNDRVFPGGRIFATDVTDGSAIAQFQRGTLSKCDAKEGKPSEPVDFLWVVDDSGSMSEDQTAVANAATQFTQIMDSAGIDYRVGVTSTDCTQGELGDAKFTTDIAAFQSDVQDPPCGSSEYGLRAGQAALNKAAQPSTPTNQRLREGSSVITIFLSDEEDQQYQDCDGIWPWDPPDPICQQNVLTTYKNFYFNFPTTAFAIVGDLPEGCGDASEGSGQGSGEAGSAYIEVAYHTNGVFGSICMTDFTPIMEEILRAAAGTASTYELTKHPISSSIQVMVEGQVVPRNPTEGFEYDVVSETVVFYGSIRPIEGDDVVISYKFFKDDPK